MSEAINELFMEAMDELKRCLSWFEYIREDELNESEKNMVARDCQRLSKRLQKLNAKYIDGEG